MHAAPLTGPGEVLLSMKAASINFRDFMVSIGTFQGIRFPLVPLSDGVGVVEAVGPGVTQFKLGDRVCPIFTPRWPAWRRVRAITAKSPSKYHNIGRPRLWIRTPQR